MRKKQQESIRRQRRTLDQQIAALQGKILALREREARMQVKTDPVLRLVASALKSIDKALAATANAGMRKSLGEARSILADGLGLDGAELKPAPRRSAAVTDDLPDALLSYVRSNPGQRGEHISAALSTDASTIRPVMKRLIADGKVRSQGQKRGMTYEAV